MSKIILILILLWFSPLIAEKNETFESWWYKKYYNKNPIGKEYEAWKKEREELHETIERETEKMELNKPCNKAITSYNKAAASYIKAAASYREASEIYMKTANEAAIFKVSEAYNKAAESEQKHGEARKKLYEAQKKLDEAKLKRQRDCRVK